MTTMYHCDICNLQVPQEGGSERFIQQVPVGDEADLEGQGWKLRHLCKAHYDAVREILGKHREEMRKRVVTEVHALWLGCRADEEVQAE